MDTKFDPSIDLPAEAWRHLIHTLVDLLPPPLPDTPEATRTTNHAAIARIADLAPANAAEAELAAQCIVARAQAQEIMRLIGLHAEDIDLATKLNAQYTAMVGLSLTTHRHLLRQQQQRRKREATQGAADTAERTRQIVAKMMLHALSTAPEIDPKSHRPENETSMRQLASKVIDLRPTQAGTQSQGVKAESGVRMYRGRLTH